MDFSVRRHDGDTGRIRPRESPDRNPLADLHPEGETGPAIGICTGVSLLADGRGRDTSTR